MSETYEDYLTRMKETYRQWTGCAPDDAADIGIRLKVMAAELYSLQARADFLLRQAFAQTAQGSYLGYHAQTRGLLRKPASFSTGILRFSAEEAVPGDVRLPAGTACAAPGNLSCQFVTLAPATLPKGATAVEVPARSTVAGKAANAAANTVTNLILPISGIYKVTNPSPFAGGSDEEEDESLRERLLQSYPQTSNGANLQYYLERALAFDEVVSAGILPRARGTGTLDVAVRTRTGAATPELLERIQAAVEENREFCIDVRARSGKEKAVTVSLMVQARTEDSVNTVSNAVKEAVSGYVNQLPMGESLLLSRLGRELLAIPGVKNYRFVYPTGDVSAQADEWLKANVTAVVYR